LLGGNFEVTEEKKKDEKVIDAEGFFNKISGDELERLGWAKPVADKDGEAQSQRNPAGTVEQRLLERNDAALPIPHRQVEKQQDQNGGVEDDPKEDIHGAAVTGSGPAFRSCGSGACLMDAIRNEIAEKRKLELGFCSCAPTTSATAPASAGPASQALLTPSMRRSSSSMFGKFRSAL